MTACGVAGLSRAERFDLPELHSGARGDRLKGHQVRLDAPVPHGMEVRSYSERMVVSPEHHRHSESGTFP
jgi:hypothetical protein